jgi:hypothetical protein
MVSAIKKNIMILSACIVAPQLAYAEPVSTEGKASAVRGSDQNSNVYNALRDARTNIVMQLLREALGRSGTTMLKPDIIEELVRAIPAEVFHVTRQSTANGEVVLSVTADIDKVWFRKKLQEMDILSQQITAGDSVAILMELNYGSSRNLMQPKSVDRSYVRLSGSSFSDESSGSHQERDSSKNSYSLGVSSVSRSSAAASASSSGATAAARASAQNSGRFRASGSSGKNSSLDKSYQNDVSSEAHDNVFYQEKIVNSAGDYRSAAGWDAIGALQTSLQGMGLQVQSIRNFIDYFDGDKPSLDELAKASKMADFRSYLSSKGAKFLLAGGVTITDGGSAGLGSSLECSGVMQGEVTATDENVSLGSGFSQKSAVGDTADACQNQLISTMASDVGKQIGDYVNKYYTNRNIIYASRKKDAADAKIYGKEYKTTFISSQNIDFQTQSKIASIIENLFGADGYTRVSKGAKSIVYSITYKDGDDIDAAISKRLFGDHAFTQIETRVKNSDVLICLDGCRD